MMSLAQRYVACLPVFVVEVLEGPLLEELTVVHDPEGLGVIQERAVSARHQSPQDHVLP
jgi:hypothetical protein